MAFAPGVKLGPYEILAPLGAGGMGEVYRARDTRLNRIVAIKILSARLSADPTHKKRFEREAKTISQLNHPHICVLHDIGQQDGIDYLVMECVEGETLAKRLEKGPLPVEHVLKYGAQLADALDQAHRSGVVHRDLKPGNVMLTPGGAKLLDFGLAKPVAPLASLATLTATKQESAVTEQGTIAGTFQYMSPEQIEGKEIDGRSDLFSLGAVLYEMLTAKKAFDGKSQLSVVSAILEKEPAPISTIKPMTPPALEHTVRQCLAKNPDERWQTAHDIKQELEWIRTQRSETTVSVRRNRALLYAALGLALAGLISMLFIVRLRPTGSANVEALISPADRTQFNGDGFAVSPDGKALAFVAQKADGVPLLWLRRLDSLAATQLPGTEDASDPFWSPDSRYIGFFAHGKVMKIAVVAGPPSALGEGTDYGEAGGTWNQNGTILFGIFGSGIYRVPDTGGTPVLVTKPGSDALSSTHRSPWFLPDGRHFIYHVADRTAWVGSLDGSAPKQLLSCDSNAVYAEPGYVLCIRDNNLFAQAFDVSKPEIKGPPLVVSEQKAIQRVEDGKGLFSVSRNGVLIYQGVSEPVGAALLQWVDRSGNVVGSIDGPGEYGHPHISPNGKLVTYSYSPTQTMQRDLWMYDNERGVSNRLTSEHAFCSDALVSPDGASVVFSVYRNGQAAIFGKKVIGGAELLLKTSGSNFVQSWSADGRFLLYDHLEHNRPNEPHEIWFLPLFGNHEPRKFLVSEFDQNSGRFSPDGKWVAYDSRESGNEEIYVAPFPGPGEKIRISDAGGLWATWRGDGKELFYLSPDRAMMAVDVFNPGKVIRFGKPHKLFQTNGGSLVITHRFMMFPTTAAD